MGKLVGAKKNLCCYITTAACGAMGLPDDCEVLAKASMVSGELVRGFRSRYLRRGK
jgi:hypothetical protein